MSLNMPPRAQLKQLFRIPTVTILHPADAWTPERPSLSWCSVDPCVGHAVSPPFKLPAAPPHARVIKGGGAEPDIFVMVSVLINHPIVPPHPGFPPSIYDEYAHPSLTHTDGGLGKFDYTCYPQVFGARWPWRGFILAPLPPTHPDLPMEQHNATFFFSFSSNPRYPINGSWIIPQIQRLLVRRAECESKFMAFATPAVVRFLQDEFRNGLPFFDPLEIEQCMTWRTFADGRDAIGRTLRYVAEVGGLNRWLQEVQRQSSQCTMHGTRSDLIGVWTGTIERPETWRDLRLAGIPLYALFKLPPGHSLVWRADRGWLDNDERFRQDPVDILVDRSNQSYGRFFGKNGTFPNTRCHYPPTDTTLPTEWLSWLDAWTFHPPGGRVSAEPCTSATFPFTTYIFSDPKIDRVWPAADFEWFTKHKSTRRSAERQRRLMLSPPLYPPGHSIQPVNPNQVHPILAVLPRRRDQGERVTHFIEETDGDCFWPVYVSKSARRRDKSWDEDYPFTISLDNGRVLLHTATPWPDTEAANDDEFLDGEVQCFPIKRRYFPQEPSDKARLKATPLVGLAPPVVIRGAQMQPGTSSNSRLGPASTSRQKPFHDPYDFSSDDEDYTPRGLAARSFRPTPTSENVSKGGKCDDSELVGYTRTSQFDQQATLGTIPIAHRDDWSAIPSTPPPPPRHEWGRLHGFRGSTIDDQTEKVGGHSERSRSPGRNLSCQPDQTHCRDQAMPQTTPQLPSLQDLPTASVTCLAVGSETTTITQDATVRAHGGLVDKATSENQSGQSPNVTVSAPAFQPQIPTDSALGADDSVLSNFPPHDEATIVASIKHSWLEDLVCHRLWMHDYFKCRLFRPLISSALSSSRMHRVVFEREVFVYPVRVSNITSPFSIGSMLQIAELNGWGDIVAISARKEADSTVSMDIGFRFVEDAFMMWNRVGVVVEERRWVFEAVKGVVGLVTFLKVLETPPRSPPDRFHRLNLCMQLEERLPLHVQDQTRLETLKELLDQIHAQPSNCADVTLTRGLDSTSLITHMEQAGILGGCKLASTLSHEVAPEIQAALPIWIAPSEERWVPSNQTDLLCFYKGNGPSPQSLLSIPSTHPLQPSHPERIKLPNKHQALPQRAVAETTPGKEIAMNGRERDLCLRVLNRRAKMKHAAWNSPQVLLPSIPSTDLISPSSQESNRMIRRKRSQARGVNVPLPEAKPTGFGFVHRFFRLWDWYDQCLGQVQSARQTLDQEGGLPGMQRDDTAVDPGDRARVFNLLHSSLDDMEAAFSVSARMLDVYGAEYADIEAELARRYGISNAFQRPVHLPSAARMPGPGVCQIDESMSE